MKYIKKYESIEDKPQAGDYVICKTSYGSNRIDKFIENRIGICIGPTYTGKNPELIEMTKDKYKIKYDDVPIDISKDYFHENIRSMRIDEIIFFSPNIEDAEAFIQANKYNL